MGLKKKKSKLLAYVFAIFLGGIGIHHFYLRHYIRGVIYLLLCWTGISSVLSILVDLWFINRWVNRHNSKLETNSQLKRAKVKKPVPVHQNTEHRAVKLKQTKAYPPVSVPEKFYDESAIVLPEFKHLMTPGVIQRFLRDAERTHDEFIRDSLRFANMRGFLCEQVPLMAYFTTYKNLNEAQRKWYFHWRHAALRGEYIPTDLSYLILFTYELLNYSFNPSAAFNVSMMVRLHDAFVDIIPKSSHYLSPWVADMLFELGETDLASKWVKKEGEIYGRERELEKTLRSRQGELDKVSFTVWKPFIGVQESDFIRENRNAIYTTFKRSVKHLHSYYERHGDDLLNQWFMEKSQTISRPLFRAAVMVRPHTKEQIEHEVVSKTTSELMSDQLKQLYRFSANIIRAEKGVRTVKVNESVFLDGFIESLTSELQTSSRNKDRFVRVEVNEITEMGSEIPAPPEVEEAVILKIQPLVLDLERLNLLKTESEQLEKEFDELEATDSDKEQDKPLEVEVDTSVLPLNAVTDPEPANDEDVQLDEQEVEFLRLFNNDGALPVAQAQVFIRSIGSLPSAFIDAINQKVYPLIDDTLIEQDGTDYTVYEEYIEMLNKLKREHDINEFA